MCIGLSCVGTSSLLAQPSPIACEGVHISHPVWSPDGTYISFLSDASGSYELYLFSVRTQVIQRLTDNDAFEGSVSWAPTADAFLFWAQFEEDADFEGYHYELASGTFTRLIQHAEHDFDLDWSPDGLRLLFQSERAGNRELYLMDVVRRTTERLTNNPWEDITPSWSPDGSRLAFASDRLGQRQIFFMDLNTRTVSPLPNQPDAANTFPIWHPDGSQLLITAALEDGTYSLNLADFTSGTLRELAQDVSSGPSSWSPDGRLVAYSPLAGNASSIWVQVVETAEQAPLVTCGILRAIVEKR